MVNKFGPWKNPHYFFLLLYLLSGTVFPVYSQTLPTIHVSVDQTIPLPWIDSLVSSLGQVSGTRGVVLYPRESPLPEPQEFGILVRVFSRESSGDQSRVNYQIRQVITGEQETSDVIVGPEPRMRDLAEFWWLSLILASEKLLPPPVQSRVSRVSILTVPHARVSLMDGGNFEADSHGLLTLGDIPIPRTFGWSVSAPGYYTRTGNQGLVLPEHSFELGLIPLPLWSLEVGFTMLQYPDFYARLRLDQQNHFFATLGFRQYWAGFMLGNSEYSWITETTESPSYIISDPLVQPGIGFLWYPTSTDEIRRWYLRIEGFLRVVTARGYPKILDVASPGGFHGSLGIDSPLAGSFSWFAEAGADLYMTPDSRLLAFSQGGGQDRRESSGPGLSGENWLFHFPAIRLGLRMDL